MLIMNEYPIYSKYLDRLVQTVRTSIKLLLKQQFDQGLHYLPFHHKFQSEITWAQLFKTNDAVSQQKISELDTPHNIFITLLFGSIA